MELGLGARAANGATPVVLTGPDQTQLQVVKLASIQESSTNPRKHFDAAKLDELAATLKTMGLIQPLVVRPWPWEKGAAEYELVAGARRYRAAKKAGLIEVPVIVRALTDEQALEMQGVENLQREDLNALEEAEWLKALRESGLAVAKIADKIGKSAEHVYARLKVAEGLIAEPKKALAEGRITAGHAILIARLQPQLQLKALEACFDWQKELWPVRVLEDWLDERVRLDLKDAPFPVKDAALLAEAGACTACPKQTKGRCEDPDCYHRKERTFFDAKRAALRKGGEFVEITTGWRKAPKGALGPGRWQEATKREPGAKPALVVGGPEAGSVKWVKVKPEPKKLEPRDRRKEQVIREAKRDRERAVRVAILDAVLERVKAPLVREDIEVIALAGLDDRDGEWLLERHEVKDAKELAARLPEMKPQELAHLLVEMALADELDAWNVEGKTPLLDDLAKRYKVDAAKIRARVGAEPKDAAKAEAAKPVQASAKAAGGAR